MRKEIVQYVSCVAKKNDFPAVFIRHKSTEEFWFRYKIFYQMSVSMDEVCILPFVRQSYITSIREILGLRPLPGLTFTLKVKKRLINQGGNIQTRAKQWPNTATCLASYSLLKHRILYNAVKVTKIALLRLTETG